MVGTAIEGEGVLITFAALAHAGQFSLPLVIALGALGSAISNQAYFFVARRRGPMLMLVGRYLIGVRSGIPLACGLVGLPPLPFTVANLAGAVLWAIPVGLLGFASARTVTAILRTLEHAESLAVVIVVLAVIVVWTYRRISTRIAARPEARRP